MKLPKKFKQKWVEALLSEKYEQCHFQLQDTCGSMCIMGLGAFAKFGITK
jgi:hypothetical protein